jgi:hypothetical protein
MKCEEIKKTKAFTKQLKLIDIAKWTLEKYSVYTFVDDDGNCFTHYQRLPATLKGKAKSLASKFIAQAKTIGQTYKCKCVVRKMANGECYANVDEILGGRK